MRGLRELPSLGLQQADDFRVIQVFAILTILVFSQQAKIGLFAQQFDPAP